MFCCLFCQCLARFWPDAYFYSCILFILFMLFYFEMENSSSFIFSKRMERFVNGRKRKVGYLESFGLREKTF